MRIGVLASGGGSNLGALLAAERSGQLGRGQIVVVGSNVPGCFALERAAQAGKSTCVVDHKRYAHRAEFEQALLTELEPYDIDLLVLAGFMRILTPAFLGHFKQGVVNIHPSLLPAFKGMHAQRQAFDYGVKVAGCTVHWVDGGVDEGPILAQASVPVMPNDTEATLSARILEQEHRLFPATIAAITLGAIRHPLGADT